MRQIEKEMIAAIKNGRNFGKSNTAVVFNGSVADIYLFGNLIATVTYNNGRFAGRFTLAGYNTVTTRSRLNALNIGVYCKDFTPYVGKRSINKHEWISFENK